MFAVNNTKFNSGVQLPFGNWILSCIAEGALSYRWSRTGDNAVTYGNTVLLRQHGYFHFACTVYVICGSVADSTICPITKDFYGFVHAPPSKCATFFYNIKFQILHAHKQDLSIANAIAYLLLLLPLEAELHAGRVDPRVG